MRCFVTGGAGFIGSNLVQELVRRGERVLILDNFSTGKRENLFPFRDNIEIIEGDIRNCACGERATINRLVQDLNVILGKTITPRYREQRAGEVRDSYASLDKAYRTIHYVTLVSFREGLEKTVEWYRETIGQSN